MEDFVDRESQFPNRRRLEIVSQTPNEIIADIYREEGNVDVEGTPITAEKLNQLKTEFANRGTTININGVPETSINFVSEPQSQINDKANIDASNLTTDNIDNWQNKLNDLPNLIDIQNAQSVPVNVYLSGQATVKQTYLSSDRKTWYRIWSDGWKECGGIITNTVAGPSLITLPVEFLNTNYTALLTVRWDSTSATSFYDRPLNVRDKSTTSFKYYAYSGSGEIQWNCSGY